MNTASPLLAPSLLAPSLIYSVKVNGEPIAAFDAGKADFAIFECREPCEVAVAVAAPAVQISVKPYSQGIPARTGEGEVRFSVAKPQNLCIDVPGRKPLFLYINGPEKDHPVPGAPGMRYFGVGVHEVGELELLSGETLYIEAGAVVRGNVVCRNGRDARIRGRGVLDGSCYRVESGQCVRSIIFENCRNILVEDIIMIHPASWMLVLAKCENVVVRNLRQIGSCMSSDGIDICGSKDVLIEDCCLRNNDDNIALKSVLVSDRHDWRGDISNVCVRRCMFLNGFPGNVMEIGYELSADRVSDVVFEDIDVLYAHGEGAVFSIHNGDRAIVENIVWKNIRVEHYWDKLVDFRILLSRYNRDERRGHIRNILLQDIRVAQSYYNSGCSVSLIGGYSAAHPVENVLFENFFLNDLKVAGADQLELHTRNAHNITFT